MSTTYSNNDKVLSLDWNGNVFVLTLRNEVTNSYSYKYSSDGNTWVDMSLSSNLSSKNPYSIKWLGSKYVMGGNIVESKTLSDGSIVNKNSILSSIDGKNFTTTNINNSVSVYDIESNLEFRNNIRFPQNIYLALGGSPSDSNKIVYSKNQGETWENSSNSSLVFSNTAYGAITNGKIWVAVGEGGNTIATSQHGNVWTGRGDYIFTGAARSVDWSKQQHMFVAVGTGGNTIASSKDGIHWIGSDQVFTSGLDVKWNGSIWVAGGVPKTGNESIAYSSDGQTWTAVTQGNLFSSSCNKLGWNGSVWTAVGDGKYAQSSDGIHWDVFTDASFANANTLYTDEYRTLVGTNTKIYEMIGNDFSNKREVASGKQYSTIMYHNNKYLYGANDSSNIGLSLDLQSFSSVSVDLSSVHQLSTNSNDGVATIMPLTIACGEGSNTLAYSHDGIKWNGLGKNVFTSRANKACWNGKMWIAVGSGSAWNAYSYDGIIWNASQDTLLTEGYDIAWNGSVWVAVGDGLSCTIVTSTDGMIWSPISNSKMLFSSRVSSITWTGKAWLAYGSGSTTGAKSTLANASAWTALSLAFTDASNVFWQDGFMSSNSQGDYLASASSEQSGYEAWRVFDGVFHASNTMWKSATLYNSSTGDYEGTESTAYDTSLSVSGEWVQIKLANSVVVKHIYPIFKTSSTDKIAKKWCFLGSNDGNTWSLIDSSYGFHSSSYPDNSWKFDSVVLPIHLNNTNAYQYYRMVIPQTYGGTNAEITSLQLFINNANTFTIDRYLKPIVTRDIVLHPTYLVNYDGINKRQCVYVMTDLELNPILNSFIHSNYVNTALYGVSDEIVSGHAFDGKNMVVSSKNGSLTYLSNESAISNNNFDTSFNGQMLNSNMTNVYSIAWNTNYFIAGGSGGNVITYGTLKDGAVPEWYPTKTESMFTSVYSVDSNSSYGYVYVPNALYFNEKEKLNIISPKAYNASVVPSTTITMNLYNT